MSQTDEIILRTACSVATLAAACVFALGVAGLAEHVRCVLRRYVLRRQHERERTRRRLERWAKVRDREQAAGLRPERN